MDNAMDVAYQVIDTVFGPESTVPWWAWVAPLAMVFATLLGPVVSPAAAGPGTGSGKGRKGKKGKK